MRWPWLPPSVLAGAPVVRVAAASTSQVSRLLWMVRVDANHAGHRRAGTERRYPTTWTPSRGSFPRPCPGSTFAGSRDAQFLPLAPEMGTSPHVHGATE